MQKPKKFRQSRSSGVKRFDGAKLRNDLYKTVEWTRFTFRFRHHNPFCYSCPNPTAHVDHLIPVKFDPDGFWRPGNHVPLCASCHSTVTQLFDNYTPPKTTEKILWLNHQRRLKNITRAIKPIDPKS